MQECDKMDHERDVEGFERFCDILEDAEYTIIVENKLTYPTVTIAVPIEEEK